jgi:hypothetical protein
MKKSIITIVSIIGLYTFVPAQVADSMASKIKDSVQSTSSANEQLTELKGAVDGLNESHLETKATVAALAKIKVSGYIQAQYQVADVKNGALSAMYNVPGSAIGKSVYGRQAFLIKRGRLKTTYDGGMAQYVLEIDATQDGLGLKDAYASFSEPWLKMFKATIGAMDRPFGYEVSYSSSQLESPERSRMIGNLFPKEKDLGVMVEFAPEEGLMSWFNFKGGVYNGMTNVTDEDDDQKDLIGRAGVKFPFQQAGLDIEGGVSGYFGKVTDFDTTSGGREFEPTSTGWTMNTGDKGKLFKRNYYGVDLQLYYATPVIGGTCIKGEYIQGYHPTKAGAADFYGSGASVTPGNAIYERTISGYYAYLIQNIDPASLQLVMKYDVYDPNTKVAAGDFTTANTAAAAGAGALTNQDLAYSTIGFGVLYYLPWAPNIRLQVYYEMPKFEKLDAGKVASGPMFGYTSFSSANNANMLTFRVQTKF